MKIVTRGEEVYQCSLCERKIRIANNMYGLSILPRCNITANCSGKLHKLTKTDDIMATPAITPEVVGLQDWFQRKVLYNHNQAILSKEWTVIHNLGNNPMFDVMVNLRDKLTPYTPTVQLIDKNTSKLIFDKPYIGTAQAVSLSSSMKPHFIDYTMPEDTTIQVSNNTGLLTLATLDLSPSVTINLTFKSKLGTNITLEYLCGNPSVKSAWVGSNIVFINQKKYAVRTLDIIFNPANVHFFANGDIPNASKFVVTDITSESNQLPYTYDSVLILLAKSPFEVPDKDFTRVINASDNKLFALDFNNVFTLTDSKVTVPTTVINNLHPPIKIIT